jgi:hypothetical protein
MTAYQAALAVMPKPVEIGESRTQPGTVNAHTLGLTPRSNNIGPIGRWARNSGW